MLPAQSWNSSQTSTGFSVFWTSAAIRAPTVLGRASAEAMTVQKPMNSRRDTPRRSSSCRNQPSSPMKTSAEVDRLVSLSEGTGRTLVCGRAWGRGHFGVYAPHGPLRWFVWIRRQPGAGMPLVSREEFLAPFENPLYLGQPALDLERVVGAARARGVVAHHRVGILQHVAGEDRHHRVAARG